jgi:hypothetical protein
MQNVRRPTCNAYSAYRAGRRVSCILVDETIVAQRLGHDWKKREMIRKLASGGYRLYSRKKNPRTGKRRSLGTFKTRAEAEQHEREVQFFKRH